MKQVYKVWLYECECGPLEFYIFDTLEKAIKDVESCLSVGKCFYCNSIRVEITTHFVKDDEQDWNNYDRDKEVKTLFYYSDNK